MQFDRDRVSWKGNEAVLDDFAGLDWPSIECRVEDPHDSALAASLAVTHRSQNLSISTDLRRKIESSDTDQRSPLQSSGSWGTLTDGSWGDTNSSVRGGEVHTPRNVQTADSAFVMAKETIAALYASQDQVCAEFCVI